MGTTVQGKCHCGQCEFTVEGKEGWSMFCHCLDCRHLNGGGRLAGLGVLEANLQTTAKPSTYEYQGGKGRLQAAFCSNCGTPLYATLDAFPNVVVVRANCLKDEKQFNPVKSIFVEDAFHWDQPLAPK